MNLRFAYGLVALAVAIAPAAASTIIAPHLVKDILAGRGYGGSAPQHFLSTADRFYFSAQTPLNGRELYVSDGTSAQLLADLVPGTGSSYVMPLGISNGRIIVDADDAIAGEQISAVDAQTGSAVALVNFGAPMRPGEPRATRVGQIGARTLYEIDNGRELWSTDGTPGGTVPLPQALYWSALGSFCSLGGHALFVGSDGRSIWRTDGTAAGTTQIASLPQEWHDLWQRWAARPLRQRPDHGRHAPHRAACRRRHRIRTTRRRPHRIHRRRIQLPALGQRRNAGRYAGTAHVYRHSHRQT